MRVTFTWIESLKPGGPTGENNKDFSEDLMKPRQFVEHSRKELLNSAVHWLFTFSHRMSMFVHWYVMTAQRCVRFCRTVKWLGCKHTVTPSLLGLLPTGQPPRPRGRHRAPR